MGIHETINRPKRIKGNKQVVEESNVSQILKELKTKVKSKLLLDFINKYLVAVFLYISLNYLHF